MDYTDLINEDGLDYSNEPLRWYLSMSADSDVYINGFKLEDVPFDLSYESENILNSTNQNICIDAQLPLKVNRNKIWGLSFNYALDPESVNSNTIYVKDSSGNVFDIILDMENEQSVTVSSDRYYHSGS